MKYPWNAVVWWEIRRIPISGLISLLIANRLSGPDANLGSPAIGVALTALPQMSAIRWAGSPNCFGLGAIPTALPEFATDSTVQAYYFLS
jgi:hypothetical protein